MTSEPKRPETYFKYVTSEVAKTILASRKLRWSSPLLFDDRFDVKRDFDFGFDIAELRGPLVDEIVNLLSVESMPDLSGNPLWALVVKCLRRQDCINERNIIMAELHQLIDEGTQLAMNSGYAQAKEVWSELLPQFRILCLSPVYDNLLMWSRYADSHKGAVLEFQCIDYLSPWQDSDPVIYQDGPPILATKLEWIRHITGQIRLRIQDRDFYKPYITTKRTEWAYQKEWRVVNFCDKGDTGLFSDYGFDPRELRSVYLGSDIARQDAADIVSLRKAGLAHVRMFRGKLLEREQRLQFEAVEP